MVELEAMIRPTLMEIEAVHVREVERVQQQYGEWMDALSQRI